MNKISLLMSLISGVIILGFYTNCGGGFAASGDFDANGVGGGGSNLGTDVCDSILSRAFDSGIYSFVRTNCAACHNNGPGQGLFANENQALAFETFKSFGYQRITENAVDGSHAAGFTGSQLQGQVDSLDTAWVATQAVYNACLADENSSADNEFDLLTGSVSLSATDEWSTLTWDLATNNFPENIAHTFIANFKLDVMNYYGEGDNLPDSPIGLLFRSPRVEFKGSENRIYIEGFLVQSEGVALENFEVFSQLIVLVEKESASGSITPDSVIINDNDRRFTYIYANENEVINNLNLSFTNIIDNTGGINDEFIPDEPNMIDEEPVVPDPVMPTVVTYADLTGTGDKAIFKNSCYQCHGNGQSRGGFTIDNFADAVAASTEIVRRVKSTGNDRMPANDVLSAGDIAIIESWVNGGMPQ